MAIIRYKEGFPTRVDTPRLDRMLRALGAPTLIKRLPGLRRCIRIEWAPLYPGVSERDRVPSYELPEPFADSKGGIELDTITED